MKIRERNAFRRTTWLLLYVVIHNAAVAAIETEVTSSWPNGFKGTFNIPLNGNDIQGGWKITLTFEQEVTNFQIWNADVISNTGNRIYVITNKSYNANVYGSLSMEFLGYTSGNRGTTAQVELQDSSEIDGLTPDVMPSVDAEDYQCTCGYRVEVIDTWPGHMKARVAIPLMSPVISGWTLFLQFSNRVSQVQAFNAINRGTQDNGYTYKLKNYQYNANVQGHLVQEFIVVFNANERQPEIYPRLNNQPQCICSDTMPTESPTTTILTTTSSSTTSAPTTADAGWVEGCVVSTCTCGSSTRVTGIWNANVKGEFRIPVTVATSSWDLTLRFSVRVDNLQIWNAIMVSRSLDLMTYYLRNPDYHGNLSPREYLSMEFIATYQGAEQPVWDVLLSQQGVCGVPTVTQSSSTEIPTTHDPATNTSATTINTDPSTTTVASTDPSTTTAASTDPSTTTVASTDPPTTTGASTDPSTTTVASTDPSTTTGASTDPSTTTVASTDPSTTTVASTDPSTTTVASTDLPTTTVASTDPSTTTVASTDLPTTTVASTDPSTTTVASTDPSTTTVASTDPSTTTVVPTDPSTTIGATDPFISTDSPTTKSAFTDTPTTTPQPSSSAQPSTVTSLPSTEQPTTQGPVVVPGMPYPYYEVLDKSIQFYEAQRSGDLPEEKMRVKWRKDSTLEDGQDVGLDLTGGWFDAGDYVKFGFPMASTATTLAWGAIQFREGYEAAGQMEWMLDCLKWATDYFMKCHSGPNRFYAQVGDGNIDHGYWGRPEDMDVPRPSMKIDRTKPGSDVAGETAAALAAASVVFRETLNEEGETDPEHVAYADRLLQHARELYSFANNYRGIYSQSIPNAGQFYPSSGYGDELAWAAAWLSAATLKQGSTDERDYYLAEAEGHYNNFGLSGKAWAYSWDDKKAGVQLLLYDITRNTNYATAFQSSLDDWLYEGGVPYTPKGLVYRDQWGVNRYSANMAFFGLVAADVSLKPDTYRDFAIQQIDYMLGDGGRSYVVGFGNNPPHSPHHRSSSCPTTGTCGWSALDAPGPNPQVLHGALIGGPNRNDEFVNDRSDYIYNEVATDYNAGFQSAVAGIYKLYLKGLAGDKEVGLP